MFKEYPFPLGDVGIMDGIDEGIYVYFMSCLFTWREHYLVKSVSCATSGEWPILANGTEG